MPMRDIEIGEVVNKTAVKVGTFKSGSDEWHAARAGRVGGSEVSAIVGLNPWESRFSLYYRKRDELEAVVVNDAMYWGTALEPVIYAKYADELPANLTITTGDTFRHIDHDWINANPDGLVWDRKGNLVKILEIKTSARGEGYGLAGTNQIPIYYLCQIYWYMIVMNCRKAELAVLISGVDYRVYYIDFDQEEADFLIAEGQRFIDDLANNVEPDLSTDFATYDALRKLNPELDPDLEVTVPEELGARYIKVIKDLKAAEKAKFGVDGEILHLAGKARKIFVGDDLIARRQMPGQGKYPYLRELVSTKEIETKIIPAVAKRRGICETCLTRISRDN